MTKLNIKKFRKKNKIKKINYSNNAPKKTGRAFVFKGGFLKCKGNSEVDKIKNIKDTKK